MNKAVLKKLLQGQKLANGWTLQYKRSDRETLVFQIEPGAEIAVSVEKEPKGLAVYVTAAHKGFGRIVANKTNEEIRDLILNWINKYFTELLADNGGLR